MTPRLSDLLTVRPYPGRVCLAGRTIDGESFCAYALTGRSAASRARALGELPNGDVEVMDARHAAPTDALRHYVALARRGDWLIVGNGDHVTPLTEDLAGGVDLDAAWAAHTFEPDPPIYTPRIWLGLREGAQGVHLGWVRRGSDGYAHRGVVVVEGFTPGSGVLLSTYAGPVADVQVSAVPTEVAMEARNVEQVGHELWDSLSPDLRVAALVTSSNGIRWLGAVAGRQ